MCDAREIDVAVDVGVCLNRLLVTLGWIGLAISFALVPEVCLTQAVYVARSFGAAAALVVGHAGGH